MAFCVIIWKAIKFRRALSRLKQAKRNAYRQSIGLPPIYPLYQRPFRWIGRKIKSLALKTCCKCCNRRPGTKITAWDKLWINGTQQNEILKGSVGFIAGVISTMLLVNFLTSQLNFNPMIVTAVGVVFGILLTFGLTFSDTIRCLFVLGIPQLFNKKGRAAILAYALVVTLSGPGKNIGTNMEILTESLVCGQDMVTNSTSELVALAKEPFSILKNAINIIVQAVKDGLERMNNELKVVIQTIYEIVNVIKSAYNLLKSIVNLCNKKLGTPFDRCMTSFTTASQDCVHQLGSGFSWMCSVVDVFQHFCYFAKIIDVFCWLPSLVKQAIFEPLKEHFKIFANGFKNFFDVRLNITYKFDHDLNQDKTLKDIARNMKNEIMGHVQWFFDYFDWMDLVVSFLMFLVVWKAFTYRYKFLNTEHFDNYYITKGMIRMDLERKRLGRDSVFPLRYRECSLYVQTFSWSMVQEEQKAMRLSLFFVGLAAIHILSYVGMDYLLFQFLELIRQHGSIKIDTSEAFGLTATIEGEGFLAAMYRSIIHGLSPVGGILPSFDTSKCLPQASTPNYHMYFLIVFLLFLCTVVAILEPYGLRLRHVICGWVYPEMMIPRERWLYVHILSSRDSFLVFARRQIRAKMKGDTSVFRVSLMDRLANTLPCCKRLFRTYKKKCFLCGRAGDQDDFENFVECPNCKTVYCKECFHDMKSICTACLNPIDYGDLTDVSEERGSDSDSESEKGPNCLEVCCNRICSRQATLQKNIKLLVNKKVKFNPSEKATTPKPPVNPRATTISLKLPSAPKSSEKIMEHQSGMLSLMFGKISSAFTQKISATPSKVKSAVHKNSKTINSQRHRSQISKQVHKGYKAIKTYDSSGSDSDIKDNQRMMQQIPMSPIIKDKPKPSKASNGYMIVPQDSSDSIFESDVETMPKISLERLVTPDTYSRTDFRAFNYDKKHNRNPVVQNHQIQNQRPNYSKMGSSSPNRKYNWDTVKQPLENCKADATDVSDVESFSQEQFLGLPNPLDTDIDPGESSSSTIYIEELDGQDREGICHHHQQVDRESVTKFDNVLSEMTLVYPGISNAGLNSSDGDYDNETTDKSLLNYKESIPHSADLGYNKDDESNGCRQCNKVVFSPQTQPQTESQSSSWWNRNQEVLEKEQFRKPPATVSSKIQDRVSTYNKFYSNMPYPPHCNL